LAVFQGRVAPKATPGGHVDKQVRKASFDLQRFSPVPEANCSDLAMAKLHCRRSDVRRASAISAMSAACSAKGGSRPNLQIKPISGSSRVISSTIRNARALGWTADVTIGWVFLGWLGGLGKGRRSAAASQSPAWYCLRRRLVSYAIDLKRVVMRRAGDRHADGVMKVDGKADL